VRRATTTRGEILSILSARNNPQVLAAVVELVAIDVIDLEPIAGRETEEIPMETDLDPSDSPALVERPPASGITRCRSTPPPTRYIVIVG
jgi:hypothetical protein